MNLDTRSLIDAISEPVLLVHPDGRILDGNKAFCSFLGWRDIPSGGSLADLLDGSTAGSAGKREYLRRCAASETPLTAVLRFKRMNGDPVEGHCEGARIKSA